MYICRPGKVPGFKFRIGLFTTLGRPDLVYSELLNISHFPPDKIRNINYGDYNKLRGTGFWLHFAKKLMAQFNHSNREKEREREGDVHT